MSEPMSATPTFATPPVVELVLGAQFSPLTKLTSGHFGLFWQELGEDWTEPGDAPLLQEQFEWFDRPRLAVPQMRLEPLRLPARFTLGNRSKDRLLQIQATRFHLNWRKRGGLYPSYEQLISEFDEVFNRFIEFAKRKDLGDLAVNQWELTYIDAFPKGEFWNTPADWINFLPGLFGSLFPTQDLDIALSHRAAEWIYEIQPRRGRLHIAARPGRAE